MYRYYEAYLAVIQDMLHNIGTFAIVTGRSGLRTPVEAKAFSSTERPDRIRGSPRLLFNGTEVFFSGIKRPGSEADNLPTFSVELKNGWNYASAPPICIHGVDSGNFTFCIFLFTVYLLCAQTIQVH